MLLSDLILDKRGSLAKVWLSAHHERKLSKQQALGVDVGESVDAILTESRPMALRVSGQLMLGVVRIYGRKVQYLMDDCREARERISMTFRPGAVDLPQDQVRASRSAITFESAGGGEFEGLDMFDWGTFDVSVPSGKGLHTAPRSQTSTREYGAFNFGQPRAASIYGGSSRAGSVDSSTQHLDSQDFQPIDLDLGLDDMSMEIGRDARSERSRSKSILRTPSVIHEEMELDQPFDAGDTFEPLDLGLDLADLPELEPEAPIEPAAIEERARRSSSELSTPPPETLELTPRVAKRVADAKVAPRPKRLRIIRADAELELPDEDFLPPTDDSPILGEENFIPANPAALRLRDILNDPVAHFLPTMGAHLFAGPAGLAPELAELFTFPSDVLRRTREEPATPPLRPAKRQRKAIEAEASSPADEEESVVHEEELEVARRESRQPSVHGGEAFESFEPALDVDLDMPLDLERRSATREPSLALPREASAPLADRTHPLAVFDTRTLSSQATQVTQDSDHETDGFSRNTALAMGVLRRELDAIEAGPGGEDKRVSFTSLAAGASKRAASAMFFELLVLGTRDAVVLHQEDAYGGIEVTPKARLYALA
ncbi:hypothetical protein CspeluHIS016_0801040 [Cutaneotrichosporon spelunceum]|uniref:Rad21/Rec8-like protein N-terminal domain-containing protein n=1 Tax=Cutaneotrichosporon spelunceum TaxID=1672016 RepID=A0AAD3YEU5_9TREE|nr:hypothetical protein CspeluHIS016_0801040 [Cutaneotrichosporon spelunceum]